jgi:hypothetical protein
MTPARIQSLVWLGSNGTGVTWEERLSELADYRNISGHCNVPTKYSQHPSWVLGHYKGTLTGYSEGRDRK